ncbi:MAG: glycosyltransferase [Candidatus Aenigmarchaeota archaeon]|nr:glycosyltransferase [Candidatus Aenigmarchaeota archaeon]
MIFVTVGTDRFEELVKAIDKNAPEVKEKIVIQIGKGKYKPKNCEYFDFVPKIDSYYKNARLIITHGGAGTIFKLLSRGKKIIGISNPHKPDEHQKEILKVLSEDNYLIWCKDLKNILKLIKNINKIRLKKYEQPNCYIHKIIEEKIDDWFK